MIKNRIHVVAPYRIASLGESVPGANFVKTPTPHWTTPLTMSACVALRSKFGAALEIGPQLRAWASAEKERGARLGSLGRAADAVLRRVPAKAPELAEAMNRRTYQRVGARFIAEGRNVLIGDHPGLGKTLEALAGIVESGVEGNVLIFCPKTAITAVWGPEIRRWLPGRPVLTMPDGGTRRRKLLDGFFARKPLSKTQFVIANIEMARTKSFWHCEECGEDTAHTSRRKVLDCGHDPRGATTLNRHEYPQLFANDWAAVVVDESQNALIRSSGIDTQTRRGMTLLRIKADGLRIALSGTPFRSRPHQLWGTLNWLNPKGFTSMWSWAETFFHINEDQYARTIGSIRPEAETALWESLNGVLLRRTKAEVASDLPPKAYVGEAHPLGTGVWIPMEPEQSKAYQQMLDTSVAVLASGELNAIGVLAEMTRLKQFAVAHGDVQDSAFLPSLPSNKFNYLLQMLEERGFMSGDPTCKVVVASQFTGVLNLFGRELMEKIGRNQVVGITGEVTGARRTEALEKFNLPVGQGPHLMFLNTKAGGVAITIDSADEMVVLDETWVPDEQEQMEDRIHRVSKPRPVFYHYLRSLGSIEEAIASVNLDRDIDSKRLLDGRRGVAYAEKVIDASRKLVWQR